MRLVHEQDTGYETLASRVETAESLLSRARGLMFRRSIPDDYALVFTFDGVDQRSLHMMCVPFPIDAVWLVGNTVRKIKRLRPWVGVGWGEADCILELPAGAAGVLEIGDRVHVDAAE